MKRKVQTHQQTYKSILNSNPRKKVLFNATFDKLDGASFLFDLLKSLYGGVTPGMLSCQAGNKTDIALMCATFWFRPVPIKDAGKYSILAPNIPKALVRYLGDVPMSPAAEQYISSAIGEDYEWMDCHQSYLDLPAKLSVKKYDLDVDISTMVREKILPIKAGEGEKKEGFNAWNAVSQLFGNGSKEDRPLKCSVLTKVSHGIAAAEEAGTEITRNLIKKIILDAGNVKTAQEFKRFFEGDAFGSPGSLVRFLQNDEEFLSKEALEYFKKKIKGLIKEKSEELVWNCNKQLQKHIEAKVGPFYRAAWSEMIKQAVTSLQSRNTRNYNFAQEQLERYESLQANQEGKAAAVILNKFFQSEYFTSKDEFVIQLHHIGRGIGDLIASLKQDPTKQEESIDEYCEEIKTSMEKDPFRNILCYIASLVGTKDELTAEQIEKATDYNRTEKKLRSQKVNPAVKGNPAFTWGDKNSTLTGRVISPFKVFRNDLDTLDCRIWIEVVLFDKGKWKKHHIPFHNSKFFAEVYAAPSPDNAEEVMLRNPRFGCPIPGTLNQEEVQSVTNALPKHRKVAKRIARIKAATRTGQLPNIDWKKCSININRVKTPDGDSQFTIAVTFKFDTAAAPKYFNMNVGDVLLSFDSNQTAAYKYAILEVVEENAPNSHPFRNVFVRVKQTGSVESRVKCNRLGDTIDRLSYPGQPYMGFSEWREQCKNTLRQWPIAKKNVKVRNKETGEIEASVEQINMLEKFESTIENWQPDLYSFNCKFARMLRSILRGRPSSELKDIRPELVRFLTDRASILNRSSLNHWSFDAIRACKGIAYAYFSVALPDKKEVTDEMKKCFDPEMYGILKKLETRRKNKAKSKVELIANRIITIAIENQAKYIVGEGKLSSFGEKKNKKKQNNRNMDWLARAIAAKVCQLAPMHSIAFNAINPHWTSHQDALVHRADFNNPVSAMRARFNHLSLSEINEWHMKKMSAMLKNRKLGTTGQYYYEAMQNFLDHYGIRDIEKELKNKSIECLEFRKIMEEKLTDKNEKIIIPQRGGRVYLATYRLTTDATEFEFNGKRLWFSDADEIAAINVGLYVFPNAKVKKSEQGSDEGGGPVKTRRKTKKASNLR